MTASNNASKQADEMRDAVAKLYTPWKDRKHKPKRRHKNFVESIGDDAQRVFHVRPDDILFGRGRAYQNHPGNRRMRAIVFKHKEQYDKVHRSRKREVVEATYDEITQHGARFLYKSKNEHEQDSYAIVNMKTALQKVRNTLGAKLSAKEKREAAKNILDVDQQSASPAVAAASSPVFAAKSIGPMMGAGKLAAFSSTGAPITSSLKLKEDLLSGSEGLMRQQEPSSLLGLIPRPLSTSVLPPSLSGTAGLEASLLASRAAGASSLYPPRSALLDPTLTSPSLLMGRLAPPPALPLSLLGAGPLLGPSSLLPPSSLGDELRRQYVSQEHHQASLGGSGLRSPYL